MQGEPPIEASTPIGAVILSYASHDAEAAQKISEGLRAAGIEYRGLPRPERAPRRGRLMTRGSTSPHRDTEWIDVARPMIRAAIVRPLLRRCR
jgi:hypothetical protein